MTIRQQAINWLRSNHPSQATSPIRTSRFYPEKEIWFFTFPSTYFDIENEGRLNVLCQTQADSNEFLYLEVPFSFFRENRDKLDIRATGKKFDLHISAKKKNWLVDERSAHVSFADFEQ